MTVSQKCLDPLCATRQKADQEENRTFLGSRLILVTRARKFAIQNLIPPYGSRLTFMPTYRHSASSPVSLPLQTIGAAFFDPVSI